MSFISCVEIKEKSLWNKLFYIYVTGHNVDIGLKRIIL
jgi:hypothetical protein